MNIKDISYRVVAIADDGTQFDLSDVTHGLTWSEAEKELSSKIACRFVLNDDSQYIQIGTPVLIYAGDDEFVEVARGNVNKLELVEANGEFSLNTECNDECHNLRHDQDDFFFRRDIPQPPYSKRFWKERRMR